MRFVCVLAALVFGCSAGGDKDGATPRDGGGDASVPGGDGGGLDPDGALDGPEEVDPPKTEAAVYAHTASTLYRLDPEKLDIVEIGAFQTTGGSSPGDVTDIALDKDGVMYAITFDALYRVAYKPGPPKCTKLASLGQMFNGLTMIPAGMIDADREVLVGVANDGSWFRVDVKSGATSATLTRLGAYTGGHASSGDAVGIIGDAVYATTKVGLGGPDHVVRVNPKTGAVLADIGAVGVSNLYGVGYWGGVMYGFADDGALYKIDLKTASATAVPLAKKPAGGWWGAGVTTRAPTTIK